MREGSEGEGEDELVAAAAAPSFREAPVVRRGSGGAAASLAAGLEGLGGIAGLL